MLTAMAWLSLRAGHRAAYSEVRQADSDARCGSLRARIVQQYSAPFDAIFDSPQAAAELEAPSTASRLSRC